MQSGKKHYRLTLADALSAHDRAIRYGGLSGILSTDAIESALARPYSGYHRRMHAKAAALVESMARNHGFADGNKRTTVILLHTLLKKSGYAFRTRRGDPPKGECVEQMILNVVNRRLDFPQLCAWFRPRLKKRV